MVKVTFTLDDETVDAIRAIAERRKKPQSLVVREAVAAYRTQEEKLSARDRQRKLGILDALHVQPRTRPQGEVDAELRNIRRARRTGWRRPTD
jgi:predicted transcriptional regulator